ncbi:MAG: InlB B-repeat-containing protein [Clostridia bacterium]|nr:InlB B-repeat-containing protein [Clostridia bacterium]
MKKTLIVAFCLLIAVAVSIALASCAPTGSNYTGTYYDYEDGVKNANDWIKLEKDRWSDNEGMSGRVEYVDGKVVCYLSMFGEEDVLLWGTVKNGVFTYTIGERNAAGDYVYYNVYTDNSTASVKDSTGQAKSSDDNADTPTPSVKTYTVKFDSKGGTDVAPKTVKEGERLEAPAQPTKTMYVFAGWYKDSGTRNVWDFDTDRVTKDMTLYAKWTAEEVRVTSVDGATIDGNNISVVIEKNVNEMDMSDKVVLNNDSATWKLYYDKMGRDEIRTKIATNDYGRLDSGSNLFYIVVTSSDETQSKTYTLELYKRYDVSVGIYDVYGDYVDSYAVTTLDTLTAPSNLSIAGYTVNGWKSSSVKIGETVPKNYEGAIRLTPDATPNTYTVTYQANGGSLSKTKQTVTFDKAEQLAVPTQEGYTFTGWTMNGEDVTDGTAKCTWKIAGDVTLTARYRANHYAVVVQSNDTDAGTASISGNGLDNVNVFFNVNNDKCATNVHTQTVTTQEGLRYPADPTAEGYLFRGWYKDGSIYNFARDIYGDLNLTAEWYRLPTGARIVTAYTAASLAEETYAEVSGAAVSYYFVAKTGGTYTLSYRNTQEGATYGARIYVSGANGYTNVVATNTTRKTITFTANAGSVCSINLQREGDYNTGVYFAVYGGNMFAAGGKVAVSDLNRVVLAGNTVTLKATENTGYTFEGWYKNGTKLSADKNYTYRSPAADSTITASYTYYTVSTDANLSDAGTYTQKSREKVTVGSTVTLTASTNNGYTWLGWYDGNTKVSEGTGLSCTITMTAENKTYTAKWTPTQYTITYNLNSGTNSSNNPATYTVESNTITLANATRAYYTFGGWYTNSSLTNRKTQIAKGSTGDLTLYAKWTPTRYAITYNLNGGTNSNSNPTEYTVESNAITFANPTRTGYTFGGWYTNSACTQSTTGIAAGSHGYVTVYAKWTIITYTITYNLNGGTNNNSNLTTYTVESNTITLAPATRDYYTFGGWYTSSSLTNQKTQITKGSTGGLTLYAKWTPTQYTITYNLNGGTNDSNNPTKYTVESNDITFADATRTGYTFGGWYTNSSLTNKKTQIAKGSTGDLTLYAKWTPTQYTITYNLNGGTNSGSNPATYTVESNTITLADATRTGYTFAGWYTNSVCTQSTTGIAAGSHGNMTVYAKWNIITYTITYNLNGGTNSGSNPTTYTVETIGEGVTLAPATKETARNITNKSLGNGNYSVTTETTAYTFLGWYKESTFVNKVTTITSADGDVMLYAKWSETTSTTTTESAYLRDGNYIYFGTYPQTEVTDSTIKTALNTTAGTLPTAENAQAWTSYGYYINGSVSDYMWYIDLTYNGEKYRGVYFTSYRPYSTRFSSGASNSIQDENGYTTGNVYWFQYEPIKWRILSEAGGEALILCEMIIDSREFYHENVDYYTFSHNGGTGYANNYALSNIRKWLNDTFYNTAFNDLQKELILLTTVNNSARSTNPDSSATAFNSGNNTYACANTQDYVFLLSEQEVTTAAYGFSSNYGDKDTARRKQNTDYAKCQGAETSTNSSYYGNGYWWLRSPISSYSYSARFVSYYGNVGSYRNVGDTSSGVVPALKIRLS